MLWIFEAAVTCKQYIWVQLCEQLHNLTYKVNSSTIAMHLQAIWPTFVPFITIKYFMLTITCISAPSESNLPTFALKSVPCWSYVQPLCEQGHVIILMLLSSCVSWQVDE